jgi:hypothetical protein
MAVGDGESALALLKTGSKQRVLFAAGLGIDDAPLAAAVRTDENARGAAQVRH